MKLSLNRIKDYVALPPDFDLRRLAFDLTMSTVEVEDAVDLGKKFENMTVGVVNEVQPHPNADKLKICITDIGGGDVREIVCGGSNVRQGMKAVVAKPGAVVRWHGAGDPVEITIAKVRGVESYGMICASSEIGLADLFPAGDEAEIVDLSDFGAQAGDSLADALGLNDIILEIDNKSLTNRPDLWGHYGIAREISAIYNLPLKEIEPYAAPEKPFVVAVEDAERCPRYIGVKIEGLYVKPSPFDLQSYLWRLGIRPINAIVDITNSVMVDMGQPTHAFDMRNISGHITVRRAGEGEKLLLLNGSEITLSADDLVIADDDAAVGLAGVMGGEKDSVLPNTDSVILEIANFGAAGVRRTATRHNTRTESAIRYEKAIDPERCDLALSLAMGMFAELYPNMSVTGFTDIYPKHLKRSEISVSLNWLERRLGKRIPDDGLRGSLEKLGFDVEITGDDMRVIAPTWRSTGDVSIPADIFEEAARLHGYENFEPTAITTSFEGAINQLEQDIDRKIREYLAFRCGMTEVFTYPWISDRYFNAIFPNGADALTLSAPPSPDESRVRPSLIPNLTKAAAENLRFLDEFAIFESTQVFFNEINAGAYDSRESLPRQRRHVGGAFAGNPKQLDTLFRKAKGVLEQLPPYVHAEPITFGKDEAPQWADETVWLNLCHNGEKIGDFGMLSKRASLACGIKNAAVMLFELDIDALKPYPSRTNAYTRLPEYPVIEYDVSMLFGYSVKWADILKAVTEKNIQGGLLRDIAFVEEYRGPKVPEGKKSVTMKLTIGSTERTLKSDEIDGCVNAVLSRLKKTLNAEARE